MRSRYSAFAMKEPRYLIHTLHPDHEDSARPREALLAALRAACRENRYMGLTILDAQAEDEHGIVRVLFVAKIFRRGKDNSILECSEFAKADGAWRYLRGECASPSIYDDPLTLTIASFLRER